MSSRLRAAWPLVAVFTVGHLAAYLLPTVVGRLSTGLGLTPAQAGLVGSALLLSSATAGFGQAFLSMPVRLPFRVGATARVAHAARAPRGERHAPRRLARLGLLLAAAGYGAAAAGYGAAAATSAVPVVVVGTVVGGFGSGTAAAVAAAGIAAQRDPHRVSALGLLAVSASAGALYLTIPRLGGGHALPFAALAAAALVMWPATRRLDGAGTRAGLTGAPEARLPVAPLPRRRSGAVLAVTMLCWSMAQNALWGVSGRIGVTQAGLSEVTVGAVFAVALGAGLTGVIAAGALGARLGRAMPIGVGTVLIAGCIVVSSSARDLMSFATGEILWNVFYPVVLSYLLGLAASLDRHGRWAVLAGSASSLGVACGPLAGSLLSEYTGYPGMGLVLCVGLLLVAVPMTAVAVHTSGRRLRPVPVPLPVPDAAPSRTAKVLAS
ncbi:MFS transporter [Streptomyces sp. NPDC091376]|uniref:MFS transporter n=1 Tax=Streptomyces sp. NPDC091376 TaxID=3365994 RepID=UPI0037F8CA9D